MLGLGGGGSGGFRAAKTSVSSSGWEDRASGGKYPIQPGQSYGSPAQQGLQQALDFYQGIHGPDLLQNELTQNKLLGQLGYNEGNYNLGVNELQSQLGYDRQRIGIGQEGIGIDRNALMRQLGVSDELRTLSGRLSDNDLLALVNQKQLSEAMRNFGREGLTNQLGTNQRGLLSNYTARGAVTSPGFANNRSDLNRDFTLEMAKLLRQEQSEDKQYGLDRERIQIGRDKVNVDTEENKAQIRDRLAQLELKSKELGINSKELESKMQQGIQRLGLEKYMNMNEIMDGLASNDINRQQIAMQIFNNALEASDYFTNR